MPLVHISHAQTFDDSRNSEIIAAVSEAYASSSGSELSKVWVIIEAVPRTAWGVGGKPLAVQQDR